ncbi:SIMPL domain-containing protein [Aliisedimentitalea scapharcae]|uniref:SIMPL domain-containing protein n=1 Tax=Aliisedimentitalea scapharcae TaxID=1524259 RepID=A0ABZ2XNK2_9RHOB
MIQKTLMATALTGALTAALTAAAMTPAMAGDSPRVITVSGQGQVEAAPDMATITLGVTHDHQDAGQAMAEVSAAMGEMLQQLQDLGLEPRQIQTSRVTLHPIWSNQRRDTDSPPEITGFAASNAVSVRVLDLERLGPVLDAVVGSGANEFNGLQFGIQDPGPLESQARALAVRDAQVKARELAEASGVALGLVSSITEGFDGRVLPMQAAMSARKAGTAIAAGEMSVSVSVNMVFDILDLE